LFQPDQTWTTATQARNANFYSGVAEERIFHRIAVADRFDRPREMETEMAGFTG
jgi:hypothetical protein